MYQSYDRNKLVRQVRELLESEGLQPVAQDDPKPEQAAMLMLRSFGVAPVVDQVEALKGAMNRTWEEADEKRSGCRSKD
ncbi:hypothetical protein A6A08_01995 [Nocardiopsis sp. TSRI0078]|uniref:hypothetical protein n=1 Tax=unclassified Nocardiopsis TaxID=2649073 RepID=UPI00093F9D73|nr:hypothetical protein [Nocardiopsis sp. TSRI0078]OKI23572.1 hypothetical protein A6A08_01995 [Nocardiopsis sp. TSRI0078]